jgi:hypothetical protein
MMVAALAALLVLAVAAYVAQPLLVEASPVENPLPPAGRELWTREKAVAVLAISEADFDLATGKLSDDDYRVLRSDYEGRALKAMDEIDRLEPAASDIGAVAVGAARFCAGCGHRFGEADAFCGSCGRPRPKG